MRYGIIALLCACAMTFSSAQAHGRHHRHHSGHFVHHRHRHSDDVQVARSGIHWEDTAAGAIKVADRLADKFKGLIKDFADAGYRMSNVHCWAPVGTHVRHSRHYLGEACDFNQTGWGKTDKFMYTKQAAAIIAKWGFTNGCEFRDCGHVGTDGQGRHYAVNRRHHYARRVHDHAA